MAKRYYWLKLKADWFSDKRIKKLRSIAGGDTHTIIYLKMMLLSLKDEGKLYFEGVEDNFASEIALALDEDAENVKLTLAFLQRHGLIEICDDDEYQLTEVPSIIGSETASTIRSRECRERKKQLALGQKALQCNTNETDCNNLKQICRVERELEIERDKEIEKEGEKDTPAPAAYGKFCNVFLSDEELYSLKSELPDKWEYYIDRLSVHIASSGRKYNNHAATIYKWAQEDIGKAAPKKGILDYSYSEEDGLLYCGKCHKPKEAYFPKGKALFGRDRHPSECDCRRAERERQEKKDADEKHNAEVERLKREGFSNPAMRQWTFENDNGKCPQMEKAYSYVELWEQMKAENHGLVLWGNVGSGKSYFAGCIANALMEKEIPVCMTNFATILNNLFYGSENRNEYIIRLCSYPLLILDDFGMERGTEYGLEQVYNVIDSRYISKKPLIATTNLTPEQLRNPEDVPHARIYGRLLEMCVPVRFTGGDFRKVTAQQKMNRLKKLMEGGES